MYERFFVSIADRLRNLLYLSLLGSQEKSSPFPLSFLVSIPPFSRFSSSPIRTRCGVALVLGKRLEIKGLSLSVSFSPGRCGSWARRGGNRSLRDFLLRFSSSVGPSKGPLHGRGANFDSRFSILRGILVAPGDSKNSSSRTRLP